MDNGFRQYPDHFQILSLAYRYADAVATAIADYADGCGFSLTETCPQCREPLSRHEPRCLCEEIPDSVVHPSCSSVLCVVYYLMETIRVRIREWFALGKFDPTCYCRVCGRPLRVGSDRCWFCMVDAIFESYGGGSTPMRLLLEYETRIDIKLFKRIPLVWHSQSGRIPMGTIPSLPDIRSDWIMLVQEPGISVRVRLVSVSQQSAQGTQETQET